MRGADPDTLSLWRTYDRFLALTPRARPLAVGDCHTGYVRG